MTSAEVQVQQAKAVIEEWANKQGHDRCWYYPELFRKLADIFELKVEPGSLPSKAEFTKGCERYREEEYGLLQTMHLGAQGCISNDQKCGMDS